MKTKCHFYMSEYNEKVQANVITHYFHAAIPMSGDKKHQWLKYQS